MTRARLSIGLPLLAKELREQSARRRTYVIRSVYAAILCFVGCVFFYEAVFRRGGLGANPFAVLGQGRAMFEILVGMQFGGIYLFMPAITCGVLTWEKERNSMSLLLLTRLGPMTILLEKYLSRLVLMFTFLLLSLPLLAFTYSLGGVSESYLWSGIWILGATAIQVGALALACSAYFRTTLAAFVGCYVIGFAAMLGPLMLDEFFGVPVKEFIFIIPFMTEFKSILGYGSDEFLTQCFGPIVFFAGGMGDPFFHAVLRSIPLFFFAGCCLAIARAVFVGRALLEPRNPLLEFFKKLDNIFSRLNRNWVTRGIVLTRRSASLPEESPIAWRETTKGSLGSVTHIVRVVGVLEAVALVTCAAAVIFRTRGGMELEPVSGMLMLLWGISVLIVAATASGLISGERSRQTLDVLAVTPLTGRDIIEQKYRGVRRLILALSAPLLTIPLFVAWCRDGFFPSQFWNTRNDGFMPADRGPKPVRPTAANRGRSPAPAQC